MSRIIALQIDRRLALHAEPVAFAPTDAERSGRRSIVQFCDKKTRSI